MHSFSSFKSMQNRNLTYLVDSLTKIYIFNVQRNHQPEVSCNIILFFMLKLPAYNEKHEIPFFPIYHVYTIIIPKCPIPNPNFFFFF